MYKRQARARRNQQQFAFRGMAVKSRAIFQQAYKLGVLILIQQCIQIGKMDVLGVNIVDLEVGSLKRASSLLIRNADSAGEPRRISIISLSSSKLSVCPSGETGVIIKNLPRRRNRLRRNKITTFSYHQMRSGF